MTSTEALEQLIAKRRKKIDDIVKKAKRAIRLCENKRKAELKVRGVQAQKDKRAQLAKLKELVPQGYILLGVEVPQELFFTIQDPKKQLTPNEIKAITLYPNLDKVLQKA